MLKPFALITLASHPLPIAKQSEAAGSVSRITSSWRLRNNVPDWNRYDEAKEEFSHWEQASA